MQKSSLKSNVSFCHVHSRTVAAALASTAQTWSAAPPIGSTAKLYAVCGFTEALTVSTSSCFQARSLKHALMKPHLAIRALRNIQY